MHCDGNFFKGEWIDNEANGYGRSLHMNGHRYEGNWKDNLPDGQGKETWHDGSTYEGYYSLGKKMKGINLNEKAFTVIM